MHPAVFWAFGIIVIITVAKAFFLRGEKPNPWRSYSRGRDEYIKPLEGAVSIYGAVVGGFIVFGLVQVGFQGGLTGYILGASYLFGIPFILYSLRRAEKAGFLDKGLLGIDALIRDRFGVFTETMFIVVTSFLFIGVLAGQFIAVLAFIREFIGSEVAVAVSVIGCLLTIAYTVWFGLRGVLANDLLQGAFEFSLSLLIPGAILYQLWGQPINFTPLSQGIGGSYGTAYPILGGLFLILSFIARADLWQRLSLVEPNKQRRVITWVVLGLLFYYIAMTAAGMLLQQNPQILPSASDAPASSLVPLIIRELINNGIIQVICVSGLLIALLSSIDSYLNLVGLLVAKLYLYNVEKDTEIAEDKKGAIKLATSRIATFGVALATIVVAYLMPDLVDIISASFGFIGIIVPVVFVALKRDKPVPDYIGAVPILVSLVILLVSIPFLKKIAFVPATFIGMLLLGALLFFRKNKPAD